MPDPMTLLKADHREAKKLMERLADSEEGRERNQMAKELEAALTLHMDLEERLVYPLVERNVGHEENEEATIEHQLAREALGKLMAMVDQPGFGAVVEMLKGGILHHVHEEETELLPELKAALPRDEWMAIGDQLAQAKESNGAKAGPQSTRRSAKRAASSRKK